MDQQTLELLRALQSGERDAKVFEQIRGLLVSQRSHLVAEDDRATLADLSELLEVWAETATPELAAAATASAAQIAEEDLEQAERAVQLYVLSLERLPTASEPLERLDALLCRRGERERLESILGMHAKSMRERADTDPERAAAVLRRLAQLRAERGGDLNAAIEAYEQALDLAADPDTIRALADLYAKRGAPGDAVQAADLYCTLGDVLGTDGGVAMLERALDQVPAHDAALDLLETYVPVAEQARALKQRWMAYIERSDNESGTDKRRLLLARAHAADGEYRDALICLAPLVDKGEAEALSLHAAFLANLHEDEPQPSATANTEPGDAAKKGNGKHVIKRPSTLVGFRLPPGEGVPDVAEPPPSDAELANESDREDHDDHGEADGEPLQFAASARNAFAASGGGTLVGFRVPPTKPGNAPADARSGNAEQPAAEDPTDRIDADSLGSDVSALRGERGAGGSARAAAVGRTPPALRRGASTALEEPGTGDARGATDGAAAHRVKAPAHVRADASRSEKTSSTDASAGQQKPARPSSGTYAAAAARAAGPAALSASLNASRTTSPGTQRAAAAARNSSPGVRGASPAIGAGSPASLPESAAAKAAALKAARSSSSPPSHAGSSSPALRASSPPPLKRRSGAAVAAPAHQSAPSAGAAAFAAPLPMQHQAPSPRPLAAAAPLASAASATAIDPAAVLAAQAAPIAAPAVLPRVDPLDDAFAQKRKRKLDPRWLVAGGVALTAVIVGVIWTSGDSDAPAAADATPAVGTPAIAAAPAPTAAPAPASTAPAAPTPTAAAAGAATAPTATSALAAAAATPAAPAAATPTARSKRSDPEVETGTVKVRGGQLAPKAVSSALDDGLSKIERCYADAIDRKPSLEGRLTFGFNVDKTGKAAKVRKISGTIKDPALQRCSTEAIQKTRFPKPKKRAAQVTLPLEFSK